MIKISGTSDAETKIKQSEEKFRNIFEHSPVGKSITNSDGLLHINNAFAEMLGYTKEELVTNWQSISHPDDVLKTQKIIDAMLKNEISDARFKKRYIHKNGSIVWADVSTYLQRDSDYKPLYFITTVIDITNDINNLQKLQDSILYSDNLINNSKAPIMVWDTEYNIQWYNPAFTLIKGISCDKIKGQPVSILFPPDKEEQYMQLIKKTTAGERWDVEEIEILNKDGMISTLLWTSALLLDMDETTIGALAQGTDITKWRESVNSLKLSKERYATLFDIMPIGWAEHKMLFNDDGIPEDYIFLDANPAFEHFIGDKRSNILGKKASEVIPDIKSSEPNLISFYGQIVITGKQIKSELYIASFDRWYSITSFRNQPDHFVVMYEDITDRKAGEKEIRGLNASLEKKVIDRTALLEASNKEMETFTYSVSHDLRAPLRHINGYIELFNKNFRENVPEKGIHYLDTILESSQQMGTLIDDLLEFSRTGRAIINEVKVDMSVVVKEIISSIENDISERNIAWDIEELPLVHCDLNLIKQVWINLILNAVKFSRRRNPAIIKIGWHTQPGKHEFYINDNGAGFDMKYADKLFGVFQRLHPTSEFEGTGIGLANVRRIISKHGGETCAYAEVDKGATFSFTLNR